jgi:hypothetical protein
MNTTLNKWLQRVALVLFIGLIVLLYTASSSNRVAWMLAIPFIPLIIMLFGYNRWREICPLAWFSKSTQQMIFFPKRLLPQWFEENYYGFQFSILIFAFSCRIYFLNSSTIGLALFFMIVILVAILSGAFLSGKTWCNYLCPVGMVEKIYTGSSAQVGHVNSACTNCVACKKNCPDIDAESAYWKESGDQQKRWVFYAFPGLVFGFYFYYFLETGSWNYYFQGSWANEESSTAFWNVLMESGWYFWPSFPKLFAAPLTFIICSWISYYLFDKVESLLIYVKRLSHKDSSARAHMTKILAAFTAFNIFYFFAGAPLFEGYPTFNSALHFTVVCVSSIWLWKEFFREERFYIQERFARKILKKQNIFDTMKYNLREVYYTYASREQDHLQHLENYKETVYELIIDGILTQESIKLLEKMRGQLGITLQEHQKILATLQEEHDGLLDDSTQLSSEKIFQLKSYKKQLQKALEENRVLKDGEVEKLRKYFGIELCEHEKIVSDLMKSTGIFDEKITQISNILSELYALSALIPDKHSMETEYLKFLIQESIGENLDKLENIFPLVCGYEKSTILFKSLRSHKECLLESSLFEGDFAHIVSQLVELKRIPAVTTMEEFEGVVSLATRANFISLFPAILLIIYSEKLQISYRDFIDQCALLHDDKIVDSLLFDRYEDTKIPQIQKEAYIHFVPLFSALPYKYIELLALNINVIYFSQGETIVKQGEEGDVLYIITKGKALVSIDGNEVARVEKNDYIGEIALISGKKRVATVTALCETVALELKAQALQEIIHYNPAIGFELMRQITRRLVEQTNNNTQN